MFPSKANKGKEIHWIGLNKVEEIQKIETQMALCLGKDKAKKFWDTSKIFQKRVYKKFKKLCLKIEFKNW